MNPSVINAIPIRCTARVSVTCQEWFKPNPRGRRSTICPACRVQINRDKTAARKRHIKGNGNSSNQDPIAQALHIAQDAVPAPPEDFLEEGPAIFGADSDFQGEVIQNAIKPAPPSLPLSGVPEEPIAENAKAEGVSEDERLAEILRNGRAELVREGEEHRAQLRAQWANRR